MLKSKDILKLLLKFIKKINDAEQDLFDGTGLEPRPTTPVFKFFSKLGKFTKKFVSKFTNKFDGNALKPLEQEKIRTAPLGFIQNYKIQILVGVTITLLGLGIYGFLRERKKST